MIKFLMIAFLFATSCCAESKTEQELRLKIAALESQAAASATAANAATARAAVSAAEAARLGAENHDILVRNGPPPQSNNIALWTLVSGFLLVLMERVFTAWNLRAKFLQEREARTLERQYEREDRQDVARQLALANSEVKEHAVKVIDGLAQTKELALQAIERASAAYTEANTVNRKIEKLGIALNASGEPVDVRTTSGPTTPINLEGSTATPSR